MTGTPNPDRSTAVPDAALVHLSGRRRGATEFIPGDRIVLSPASDGGIELSTSDETPPHSLAVLERRGHTFGLTVTPGADVWINGERLDELVLASGDVLEFGGEAVLRYRLYPPERRRYKTMGEAFSDCVECARYDSPSPIRRAAVFASRVPPEIMTQTAPRVRLVIVVLAVAAIGLAGSALVRSARVERTLHTEVARVEGLARLLDRPENRALTAADLEAIRSDIEDLRNTEARIDELEALAGARERVIASASRSVVFLQGAYGFTESKTGRPLRFAVSSDGSPAIGPGGQPAFTAAGNGPEVEIFYTGTGFVATDDGRIVTNRHVAEPWLFDEEAKALIEQGLVPVMRRFIGYLPGQKEPFDVSLIAASDTADVAVLRCQNVTAGLPALNLDDLALDVGDEVVVLGYPTGIRAMIARSQREIVPLLEARGEVDFWEVARVLADGGHIAPLATRGIVGQITAASVVYDAGTTHGGSGGPVISLDGAVVAINAAILTDFAGSNLGVPAAEALRLLKPSPETT
jgi:serine protease Do